MARIILSCIALTWICLSLFAAVLINVGLFTSAWLIRVDTMETRRLINCPLLFSIYAHGNEVVNSSPGSETDMIIRPPSIGPWLRCQTACNSPPEWWSLRWETRNGPPIRCQVSLWGFGIRPAKANAISWTTSVLFLLGCALMTLSIPFVVFSMCKRDLCDHSLFSFTGAVQGLGDLLLFVGLILWPIGWDSITIREVCGGAVGPYSKGNCTFGWGPICTIAGVVLTFVCALLSVSVDRTIRTHNAMRQMLLNGKNCVFLH
ncbi:unnamed protein product [Calicophoron daubneyi]|uniref:Uncharacterized protein n=1 Tax=Calicophoron daubneyi TaxID=300641 RepID=A0AAV2T1G6_CALDB